MTKRLTTDDVEWLERRLSSTLEPVQPRAEFVRDARAQMLSAASQPPPANAAPRWMPLAGLALLTSLVALAGFILWQLSRARRG